MKVITLLQAGALLLLAVIGAYAGTQDSKAPCDTRQETTVCDL
ncbi:MAG: hypothetical protein ACU0CC_20895 [Sagittula sp.]|jgi:hypothetical protein|nr:MULTISPECIES: hypothetical protein [unclassified Sagittula]WHZ33579.1 hypothetical protein QNI11_13065 [Sagittula sp. MA-2]